jgi:hypothetical protein
MVCPKNICINTLHKGDNDDDDDDVSRAFFSWCFPSCTEADPHNSGFNFRTAADGSTLRVTVQLQQSFVLNPQHVSLVPFQLLTVLSYISIYTFV